MKYTNDKIKTIKEYRTISNQILDFIEKEFSHFPFPDQMCAYHTFLNECAVNGKTLSEAIKLFIIRELH